MELLQQRQKDIEFRTQVQEMMAKVETDYQMQREKNEKLIEESNLYKKTIGAIENKLKQKDIQFKQEKEQFINQIQEGQKIQNNYQYKINQTLHEMRKKEQELSKIKEQIRKQINEKNIKFANPHLTTDSKCFLQKNFSNTLESQELNYLKMISASFEKKNKLMNDENNQLKNILYMVFNELNANIYNIKNQYIEQKSTQYGQDLKTINCIVFENQQLNDLNKEILNLPLQKGYSTITNLFHENLQTISFYIEQIASYQWKDNYVDIQENLEKIKKFNLKRKDNADGQENKQLNISQLQNYEEDSLNNNSFLNNSQFSNIKDKNIHAFEESQCDVLQQLNQQKQPKKDNNQQKKLKSWNDNEKKINQNSELNRQQEEIFDDMKSQTSLGIQSQVSFRDVEDLDNLGIDFSQKQPFYHQNMFANEFKKWHLTFDKHYLDSQSKNQSTIDKNKKD